jgi:hypothetical protein
MNKYLGSDPSMTLGEAIQNMRAAEPQDFATQASAEIVQSLEQHDAVHILFDLGTSIQDEIAAHIWTILATTANVSQMHLAVATQEHRSVLAGIGHIQLLRLWCASLPRIVGILFKSWRMKRKIAVEDLSTLKQQSILVIRQDHGIVL